MHLLVIFKATITVVVIRLCKNIIQRCGNSVAVLQQIFYLWHCFHKTYEKKIGRNWQNFAETYIKLWYIKNWKKSALCLKQLIPTCKTLFDKNQLGQKDEWEWKSTLNANRYEIYSSDQIAVFCNQESELYWLSLCSKYPTESSPVAF